MTVWTPERTERVFSLYRSGISAGKIAKREGLTRNQVIGKLHRSGLVGDPLSRVWYENNYAKSGAKRKARRVRDASAPKYTGDWDDYLVEPYALRKKRMEARKNETNSQNCNR